ncbi:8-oxo-dGTP diphosphatase [Treponema bryantii]|uniref:8-oxo-dGTP diphosphatase n=1 Tax=Treponema bryantii TaxID=163 RepID=A0A1H9IEH8_9SPIR|nr:NUDIX domain-containing protein [Treponema bryantii]BDC93106.1 7,8-dihydro-8-oxoguanine-triphosphatase [Treponema bryantii]SEQ72892.1 8-oxo-dGTP diphosphatase [Treponema bryantii]
MSRSIACIDYRNGKIFIAKRQMVGDMGGRWEFPGGKIEDGEDLQTAVVREMQEEFGVTVTVGRKITSGTFTHKGKPCTLDVLEVKFPHDGIQNKFELTEHTDYKWEDIELIPSLNFVDSDLSIYNDVKKWCENEK